MRKEEDPDLTKETVYDAMIKTFGKLVELS